MLGIGTNSRYETGSIEMSTTTMWVGKDRMSATRLVTTDLVPLADGQVRVWVEQLALTSNNVTYAAYGDMMYWQLFPTGEDGWGIVPAWGFGTVAESRHPRVAVGERLFGFWPMGSSVVLQPDKVSPADLFDASAHRAAMPAIYNQYMRSSGDPFYSPDSEAIQALLRPLFGSSWLLDDWLADNGFFGAEVILLSSASSKTAIGTAFQLSKRSGVQVVGLTSAANRAYCESLGCYHRVLAYEELGALAPDTACVYLDFAGSTPLRRSIHKHFRNLKHSSSIGLTHVEQAGGRHAGLAFVTGEVRAPREMMRALMGSGVEAWVRMAKETARLLEPATMKALFARTRDAFAKPVPGPAPIVFFAGSQVDKRTAEWGLPELTERMVAAWHAFRVKVTGTPAWLEVEEHRGPEALEQAYATVLSGRIDPRIGRVIRMQT